MAGTTGCAGGRDRGRSTSGGGTRIGRQPPAAAPPAPRYCWKASALCCCASANGGGTSKEATSERVTRQPSRRANGPTRSMSRSKNTAGFTPMPISALGFRLQLPTSRSPSCRGSGFPSARRPPSPTGSRSVADPARRPLPAGHADAPGIRAHCRGSPPGRTAVASSITRITGLDAVDRVPRSSCTLSAVCRRPCGGRQSGQDLRGHRNVASQVQAAQDRKPLRFNAFAGTRRRTPRRPPRGRR